MEKYPHESVGYIEKSDSTDRCSNCRHFIAPSECEHVQSPISPKGWCVRYEDSNTGSPHFGIQG
jgi:hypothetical protein